MSAATLTHHHSAVPLMRQDAKSLSLTSRRNCAKTSQHGPKRRREGQRPHLDPVRQPDRNESGLVTEKRRKVQIPEVVRVERFVAGRARCRSIGPGRTGEREQKERFSSWAIRASTREERAGTDSMTTTSQPPLACPSAAIPEEGADHVERSDMRKPLLGGNRSAASAGGAGSTLEVSIPTSTVVDDELESLRTSRLKSCAAERCARGGSRRTGVSTVWRSCAAASPTRSSSGRSSCASLNRHCTRASSLAPTQPSSRARPAQPC